MKCATLIWVLLFLLRFGLFVDSMIDPVDFLALQAIRKSLDDLPGSNFFDSWDFTADPCTFSGVYCDGDKVIALNLGDSRAGSPGLSGRIDPAIGKLSSLTELSIVPGRIMGSLPNTISHSKNLRFLAISRNFISGKIPTSLGELRRLRTLDLSYNQLTGSIPISIGSLPELTNLILCHNHFNGTIPRFETQSLTRIDLKRNNLTGVISPVTFPVSLQYLSLAWNQLTGPVNRVLIRLNQLSYLDLSLNRFTGVIPGQVFGFPITNLQLQRNYFYGLVQPANQVTIPTVDLSYNRFTGEISPLLSNVQNLYLNNNRFTGRVPVSFVDRLLSSSIQTLYLQHNFLTGIEISPAANIPVSSSLCLQYNCMVPPVQTPCPVKAGSQITRPTIQCMEWRG
ncbi:hypothetical protein AALP_AA6G040400 [Arabis alpina]|uniref:Leucine-rich repeat-containing N-terminal plant-type domain-containing protein n=1 Tax=Arabis alpina TaxID=50452 RepID=A0A087GLZ6_ARAAL|nr:hypothetical protein AALP_AA6G040400 [Arabis alpina]